MISWNPCISSSRDAMVVPSAVKRRAIRTVKRNAMAKVEHAASCELMKNELADSKKVLNTGSKRVAASAE